MSEDPLALNDEEGCVSDGEELIASDRMSDGTLITEELGIEQKLVRVGAVSHWAVAARANYLARGRPDLQVVGNVVYGDMAALAGSPASSKRSRGS